MISPDLQKILDERRRGIVVRPSSRISEETTTVMERYMARPCAPDPVYECERCQDTGYRRGQTHGYFECECRIRKVARKVMAANGIDPDKTKRFNDFRCKNAFQQRAVSAAVEFVKSFHSGERQSNGLFFGGKPGSGKTHLAKAVAVALIEKPWPVKVETMQYGKIMEWIKKFGPDEPSGEFKRQRYIDAELLWIEDMFKEKSNSPVPLSDADRRHLHEIINPRYENQIERPILISSELTISEIYALDEGIGRRIKEMCHPNIFEFIGEEYVYDIIGEKEKQKAVENARRQTQGKLAGLGRDSAAAPVVPHDTDQGERIRCPSESGG